MRGDHGNHGVSIHALLAECDAAIAHAQGAAEVSIHALLAECDEDVPRNGANQIVSIHALLAECDTGLTAANGGGTGFNPRTPCGVRPIPENHGGEESQFQSTHSLRSATRTSEINIILKDVSIHALLAECDSYIALLTVIIYQFQSTHSLRSATPLCVSALRQIIVSIHALLAECDIP